MRLPGREFWLSRRRLAALHHPFYIQNQYDLGQFLQICTYTSKYYTSQRLLWYYWAEKLVMGRNISSVNIHFTILSKLQPEIVCFAMKFTPELRGWSQISSFSLTACHQRKSYQQSLWNMRYTTLHTAWAVSSTPAAGSNVRSHWLT